jgi:hypothetical protein
MPSNSTALIFALRGRANAEKAQQAQQQFQRDSFQQRRSDAAMADFHGTMRELPELERQQQEMASGKAKERAMLERALGRRVSSYATPYEQEGAEMGTMGVDLRQMTDQQIAEAAMRKLQGDREHEIGLAKQKGYTDLDRTSLEGEYMLEGKRIAGQTARDQMRLRPRGSGNSPADQQLKVYQYMKSELEAAMARGDISKQRRIAGDLEGLRLSILDLSGYDPEALGGRAPAAAQNQPAESANADDELFNQGW